MATIIATLNAASPGTPADLVTADIDLTYKVYNDLDSYAVAEAFGSHNSDANVSVSGGVVTILNVVDSGISAFKISSIDEAGNESILSPAVSTDFKAVLNISQGQFISATGLTALSTGIIKYEFNMPTIPVTDGTKIITIGTLVCSYSANQLRMGSSAGLDLYPIAGVEGADIEITYLNTAPYTTTLKVNGVPITADTVSGTKAAVSGNAIQFPTGGADTVSYAHARVSEDGTPIVTYELNDGSGTTVADTSGNADDGTITVGTGNISTVWVSL